MNARRETFKTEARQGFSQVRPTQTCRQSVKEAEPGRICDVVELGLTASKQIVYYLA
jgi:hypothetical protein